MVMRSCVDILTLSILNATDHVDLENVIKRHDELLGIDGIFLKKNKKIKNNNNKYILY
jgi:hypothetical protein